MNSRDGGMEMEMVFILVVVFTLVSFFGELSDG